MYTQTLVVPTLRVSSPLSPLSVPSICISPAADAIAHPDSPMLEPVSPEDALSPRAVHLLPPPVLSPLRHSLSSSAKVADKKGLDQSTFQDLLVANRERTARRSVNSADRLRREVVVKAHHSKQFERRALFLSKIAAPPSPTSTETAVTPPESPAVFHFTLPSPGLASPLELFENVKARDSWVEQVDYNRTSAKRAPSRLPSLDQITARLRRTVAAPNIPSVVISPSPERLDEVKPRASRLPDSIRARVRSASPPTPTAPAVVPAPVATAPSQLIIQSSPPKSIKPVLVPQSIPALRHNHITTKPELAPVAVMSWRDRAAPTPRKDQTAPRKDQPTTPRKDQFQETRKEPLIHAGSWRDGQGQITSWREVPVRKEVVRSVAPISPRTVSTPVGAKPAPVPARTLNMNASAEGLSTSRRSALCRIQRDAVGAVKLSESERRAVEGRNMLDKLSRRISAPAEMQGSMRRGAPIGGF